MAEDHGMLGTALPEVMSLVVRRRADLTLEGCVANPGRTCASGEVRNDLGTVPCENDVQQPQADNVRGLDD